MALAWKAGWVNSPQGFESPILRHFIAQLARSSSSGGFRRLDQRAELPEDPGQHPGDLHLAETDLVADLLLGAVLEEPAPEDQQVPWWQRSERFAEHHHILDVAVVIPACAEQ